LNRLLALLLMLWCSWAGAQTAGADSPAPLVNPSIDEMVRALTPTAATRSLGRRNLTVTPPRLDLPVARAVHTRTATPEDAPLAEAGPRFSTPTWGVICGCLARLFRACEPGALQESVALGVAAEQHREAHVGGGPADLRALRGRLDGEGVRRPRKDDDEEGQQRAHVLS
jgi:hypothetical protein